jgi:NAD-dependent deacetylase
MKITKGDYIVLLTGAGVSAESGIKTFRDHDGLWENHRVEEVATPEAFKKDPVLVWRFYKARYYQSLEVSPNPGHYALVDLEKAFWDRYLLVTQNVDGLHTRAGSKRVIEMHGSLHTCFCVKCKVKFFMSEVDLSPDIPDCPQCQDPKAKLRPDIVWFGEMPYHLDEISTALCLATVFISIGTSGNVYPAADFINQARKNGARTLAINLDVPQNNLYADTFICGKSGEMLPNLVKEWTTT